MFKFDFLYVSLDFDLRTCFSFIRKIELKTANHLYKWNFIENTIVFIETFRY